jgi:FKBP-type peptidyl-prolyl cis-trans isomerase (trigger factor)
LGEIAEQEKLEVSETEITERIATLKSRYQDPKMQAELDKPENRRELANRILTEKTVARLVQYASK